MADRTISIRWSTRSLAAFLFGAAVVGYATMRSPVALMVLVVLPVVTFLILRIGPIATGIAGAVLCLAFSAFGGRYVAAAAELNQVGVIALVGFAIILLPRLSLPRSVVLPGALFVLLSTVASVLAARRSFEYGLRAWVALVCAPAGVVAAGALLRRGVLPEAQRLPARACILGAVVLASVGNVAVGLRQAFWGLSGAEVQAAVSGESTYQVGDQIRLMGTFQTNQDFGLLAACAPPALLVYAVLNRGWRRRIAGLLSFLMYAVTFLSLTRTALIAAIATGVIGLLVWGRGSVPTRALRLTVVALATLGILSVALSNIDSPRIRDSLDRAATLLDLNSDSSYRVRSDSSLPYAVGLVEDHPFGLGAGSAGPVSQELPDIAPRGTITTDNGYIMIAVQLGVIGLAVFAWMLVALAIHLRRSSAALANAGSAAIVSLLIAMMMAGYWSLLSPIGVLGVAVGIAVADAANTMSAIEANTMRSPTPGGDGRPARSTPAGRG